ncbi:MAG: DNA topoisomerase IB [Actinomycetota bacterium]|nr:DNA topoisomerase IB [Actinomycetota bacterium]
MPRLRRADCSTPGIRRVRKGRGFTYLDADGRRVDEPELMDRIAHLAIPPAWRDVWICPYPNGHLQATGTDAAGRKQYRYHDEWRRRQDQAKFDEMLCFARALPDLRGRVAEDLAASEEITRERALACAVRLLDRGFFRIGSEDYAAHNETFGLATMRKEHARLEPGNAVVFDYVAKSGKHRVQAVTDPDVHEILGRLKRRRGGGPELLAYREGSVWRDIRSPDINLYIKDATGADYSAKDFRTWNATVLAAVGLGVAGEVAGSRSGRKRAINRAVKEVAHYLGNTPAVCRASYIDPRIFDAYQAGVTIGPALRELAETLEPGELPIHHPTIERAVIDLVSEKEDSAVLEKVA